MLIGAIGFALYIGYTTSILQSHNASKRLYTEKYSSIKQYMLFRKLPMELRRRISDYYENRYQGRVFRRAKTKIIFLHHRYLKTLESRA